ncbi:MAG: sugar phosphate isomerase/epimerase family protein [Blastocatellia bacterium]
MINRRNFMQTAAGAALLSAMPQDIFAAKLRAFGVQLYTVRDQMKNDLEGSIARVAALGYKEVEFAGYFDRRPDQIRDILKKNGLTSPSVHIALDVLRKQLDKAVADSVAIGHKFVVCPFLMPDQRKTLDQYREHAALFNKAGAAFQKAGIQFAYHNHDFEFMPLDGKLPIDLLLAETDPKLVKIELDLYWITKAGHDPLALFSKHPGRFPLVHVKDMDNTPKKFFAEIGRGTIDFKKIFAQAKKAGIVHYFVEQDQCPGNPFDSLKISADYLKQLTF